MLNRKIILPIALVAIFSLSLINVISPEKSSDNKEFIISEYGSIANLPSVFSTSWVDSVYNSLTLEERVAQLLMIRVHTDKDAIYYNEIERLVREYNVGGLCFFRGGPERQLKLTNHLQSKAKTPMLVSIDAEWGLSMRLDSTISFPRQMTLGAIRSERHIYEMGLLIGYQAKRIGVHINFAPVIDVNNNPKNPVINFRSFGECRYNVARKGIAYMQGMQDAGIIACAKHFPGHGDTDSDSHYTLPVIKHPVDVLDSIHIYPFRQLIDNGLLSVMVAHLNIPALDKRKNYPSTLSYRIVTNLLQEDMGFKGLVITDALDMKGVSDYVKPGELEVQALKAGNDILLLPQDVNAAVKALAEAITNGEISEKYLEQKVKKVLYFKQSVGLNKYRPMPVRNLHRDLNSNNATILNKRLIQSAITLIKNNDSIVPIKYLEKNRIAAVSIGSAKENAFQAMIQNYYPAELYSIDKEASDEQIKNLTAELKKFDIVIVAVQNNNMFVNRRYGITNQTIKIIDQISAQNKTILALFANPYSLEYFSKKTIGNLHSIIIAYQDGVFYEQATAQVIFGGMPARGRLPVSVPPYFPVYTGIQTPSGFRIRFSSPEKVGIDSEKLNLIDSIAINGINQKAYPGCQIAVIKNGVVIYNKSFGHHTYEKKRPVRNSDLYDLASLTKIASTTLSIMKLVDEGKIDIKQALDYYYSKIQGTTYSGIEIREILAHQAMLRAWIPFYINTLENNKPNERIYQKYFSEEYPTQVAKDLYIHKNFRDSIFNIILETPRLERKRYVYSDLGFIMLAEMIEGVVGETLDNYVMKSFYGPLGLETLGYLPLSRYPLNKIIPTENDTVFRKQIIQGYVNDPAAAMLGGVSGHAGLFGNAIDMAVLMEMINRKGNYAGRQYIKPETIEEFTRVQYAGNQNRRGLGFDKPTIVKKQQSPACASASAESYGHSGFTGTYAWVDPTENLVYVFLSNRVFPDATNRKINDLDIRINIHQAIYDAINASKYLEKTITPL
ncbi:MAG: serine hydrolase [Bacteroidetes bacterium]|nr:serine hydrolase [Bacteroidota bacterium]